MTPPPLLADKFRWDRLTYASALGYALLAGGQSIGFVLGELRHQFHLSGVTAALHGSAFGVTALTVGICGVPVVDRLGRRTSLLVAAMTISFGITLFCIGPAWPVTLSGAVMAGLGGALLAIVMPGLISDHHGEHRAAAFAAVNGAVGLTAVSFSLVVGGSLALHWSWRPPYLILTAIIVLVLTAVAMPVAVPEPTRHTNFTLAHLRDRDVFIPWLHLLNAIFPEMATAVWATTYLKEVGHASGGLAAAFAGSFGVAMFLSRQVVPRIVGVFGDTAVSSSFIMLGTGSLVMVFGGGLLPRVVGLSIVGLGAGPLYPLDVDRLYLAAEHKIDTISLGAICMLAAGVAITLGPLALGILADSIGLRTALLIVPASCVLGAITQWRRVQPQLQPASSCLGSPDVSTTRVRRLFGASRSSVYRALLDPEAVQRWMVPDGMTSHVHSFDGREGGTFRISLTYDQPTSAGKTTAQTDTFHGRFVELVPDTKIVQAIEFETDDPTIAGEMTITYVLDDVDGGTELVGVHENLPRGVAAGDNELGWTMSMDKLAKLVEGGR